MLPMTEMQLETWSYLTYLHAAYDDFTTDVEGNSCIATHPSSLTEWTMQGIASDFIGDGSVEMNQPTSVTCGRGSTQAKTTLYMITYGSPTSAGQVIAINPLLLQYV